MNNGFISVSQQSELGPTGRRHINLLLSETSNILLAQKREAPSGKIMAGDGCPCDTLPYAAPLV